MSFFGDDEVPLYRLRHERIGYGKRKFWTVRANSGERRLVTVMGSKAEAVRWIERNTEVTGWLRNYEIETNSCYR